MYLNIDRSYVKAKMANTFLIFLKVNFWQVFIFVKLVVAEKCCDHVVDNYYKVINDTPVKI